MVTPDVIARDAVFGGPDDIYRYRLDRELAPTIDGRDGLVVFALLNPSKADKFRDDNTATRGMNFTTRWGYSRFAIVNLYALRATDPDELKRHPSPCGPDNDAAILVTCAEADVIVCGWGSDDMAAPRAAAVTELLRDFPLWCFVINKDGQPKHPLYVAADAPLIPYNDRAIAIMTAAGRAVVPA